MSDSVADAIKYCNYGLHLTDFDNRYATVKFLKMINRAFDVLDSHNLSRKGFKKALCASNHLNIEDFARECIEYISNLEVSLS